MRRFWATQQPTTRFEQNERTFLVSIKVHGSVYDQATEDWLIPCRGIGIDDACKHTIQNQVVPGKSHFPTRPPSTD